MLIFHYLEHADRQSLAKSSCYLSQVFEQWICHQISIPIAKYNLPLIPREVAPHLIQVRVTRTRTADDRMNEVEEVVEIIRFAIHPRDDLRALNLTYIPSLLYYPYDGDEETIPEAIQDLAERLVVPAGVTIQKTKFLPLLLLPGRRYPIVIDSEGNFRSFGLKPLCRSQVVSYYADEEVCYILEDNKLLSFPELEKVVSLPPHKKFVKVCGRNILLTDEGEVLVFSLSASFFPGLRSVTQADYIEQNNNGGYNHSLQCYYHQEEIDGFHYSMLMIILHEELRFIVRDSDATYRSYLLTHEVASFTKIPVQGRDRNSGYIYVVQHTASPLLDIIFYRHRYIYDLDWLTRDLSTPAILLVPVLWVRWLGERGVFYLGTDDGTVRVHVEVDYFDRLTFNMEQIPESYTTLPVRCGYNTYHLCQEN